MCHIIKESFVGIEVGRMLGRINDKRLSLSFSSLVIQEFFSYL
jgi:hypothetical protein